LKVITALGGAGRSNAVLLRRPAGDQVDVLGEPQSPHGGPVARAPVRGSRDFGAVDVCDAPVAELREMAHGLLHALGVVAADEPDPVRLFPSPDGDQGSVRGPLVQGLQGARRRQQDDGVAALPEKGLDGDRFAAGGCHGAQGELVSRVGRGQVAVLDDVAVEGLVQGEGDPDQLRRLLAQLAGAIVGQVAQPSGLLLDACAGLRARPGNVPHDDRHQLPRDPRRAGHVGHRRTPRARGG
jgi:hypothetical protein